MFGYPGRSEAVRHMKQTMAGVITLGVLLAALLGACAADPDQIPLDASVDTPTVAATQILGGVTQRDRRGQRVSRDARHAAGHSGPDGDPCVVAR